jgi:hypothetical protein
MVGAPALGWAPCRGRRHSICISVNRLDGRVVLDNFSRMDFRIFYVGKKRVACRNGYCTVCQKLRLTEGFRSLAFLQINLIPLIPLGVRTRWICSVCRKDPEAKRPSKAGILIAGVAAGALFMFIALMIGLEDKNPDAVWSGLIGLVIASGSIYLLRSHSQARRVYAAASIRVPPLATDVCPYCHNPLLPRNPPKCQLCNVRILTH